MGKFVRNVYGNITEIHSLNEYKNNENTIRTKVFLFLNSNNTIRIRY